MYWTDLYFKIQVVSEILGGCLLAVVLLTAIYHHLKSEGWLDSRKEKP